MWVKYRAAAAKRRLLRAPNGKETTLMWNNCKKAVTFSYDDGVESDKKLLEIFNPVSYTHLTLPTNSRV